MIHEIYNRSPQDPNYVFGVLEHSDAIESIITKIKMILSTSQGQVLGDLNFGVGLEDLVFETRINKMELEEKIKSQIMQYVDESKDYKIVPQVSFGRADGYDYAVIDIFINDQKVVGILVK
jgi:hypothetical protein